MSRLDDFENLARYNQWANSRLYEACAQLSAADYTQNRGAFFGSIHGTLNHLLLVDYLWLERLIAGRSRYTKLDEELFADFDSLKKAREAHDARLIGFVAGMHEDELTHDLTYVDTKDQSHTTPRHMVLAHLFNHQTHHRGQVTTLLQQANVTPPALDLMVFSRQQQG